MFAKEPTGVSIFMEAKDRIVVSRVERGENGEMGIMRTKTQL